MQLSQKWLFLAAILFIILGLNLAIAAFPEDYDKTLKQFQASKSRADYETAAAGFSQLAKRADAGTLRPNCIYWEGECWFALRDFLRALMTFERVLSTPQSNKEEDARYKAAICCARLNWIQTARWELSRFMRDFPASRHINSIRAELDKLPKEAVR